MPFPSVHNVVFESMNQSSLLPIYLLKSVFIDLIINLNVVNLFN